ncbi:MAG TPA: archaeosortase/exosortase family protein, partial [Gemmatales bacterium]|nr:archaeosortase/exosortase family protein [Gemmatales bacterium]
MNAHGRARWFASHGLVRNSPALLLLAILAYPTFRLLIPSWEQNPDYAHGWLGLPALAWLYWKRKPWIHTMPSEPWLGCLLILAGGALHLGTLVVRLPLLDY